MVCVADTHALVWYLSASARLGKRAAALLERQDSHIVIPTIVLAELKYLHQRNRIPISLTVVQTLIKADPRCLIYPLNEEAVNLLPVQLDIHDAIICSTALACQRAMDEKTVVLTKDEAIVKSGLVETAW